LRLFLHIAAQLVALISIVASQFALQHRFTAMEIELPFLTTIAMSSVVPIAIGLLWIVTIVMHVAGANSPQTLLEGIVVCVLGTIVGFYVIACCLAFVIGPTQLSYLHN
jgi:hypothetical protein